MMRKYLIAAAVPLALAACSKPEPLTNEEVAGSNVIEEVPADEGAVNEVNVAMPPANVAVEAPPKPDPVAQAQQIQEDADATGMTARLPADDETEPTGQKQEDVQDRR